MAHVNIYSLGGLDENGKNCYALEVNDEIFVVNFGAKVPINSVNGVDTLIPNFDYLEKNKNKVKGIFITDIKNESFSGLPWLLMKLPNATIYSSPFNKLLILDRLSKYRLNHTKYKNEVLVKETKVGNISVKPINVAGSLPGCIGLDFITPDGDVIFMFNFVKADLGIYGRTDYDEIKRELKDRKVLALVADSGHSNYAGYSKNKIVLPNSIKQAFVKTPKNKRIIVGAYDEEMYALQQILDLAKAQNRPVVTYGKTYAQTLFLIKKIKGEKELPQIIEYKDLKKYPNAVILVTGSVERLYSRFLRIAGGNDVLLDLRKTDAVLMIAPPVNGLESTAALCLDDIARNTPHVHEVTGSEYYSHRPAREDLLELVEKLQPENFIPVQGLYRYLVDINNAILAKKDNKTNPILLSQNGKIAHFVDGKLFSVNGKIKNVGDLIIDGFGVGDISSEVINEREMLGRDGLIVVSLMFNTKTKEISPDFHINYVGIIDRDDRPEMNKIISQTIVTIIEEESFERLKDLQERLRRSIRKKVYKNCDKEPMIAITFNTL
ncbi:ribonuclease J [Mycoplasma sp. Ms02]|uniref:MBL fold metallo-hydrolase RNA specificity domain-containing protein n=1 Tax=Mycoplasma sp. Ms02 TaxID=353851 RepID=UPI001C89669E|nr:ribonuclease J [Mycoplasma sp. Ms02]QZE12661.1 ribonuclease J [Mycoplasma sp. Ms02]